MVARWTLGVTLVLLVSALVGLTACYDPAIRSCVATCGGDRDCPSGLTCAAGLCVRQGDSCDDDDDGGIDAAAIGDWSQLSVGSYHACAIDADRALWCWGNNDFRQLGLASPARSGTPLRVDVGGPTTDWVRVNAGLRHTCAIRAGGTLWCWGINDDRQCGVGAGNFVAPTRVADPTGLTGAAWTEVATGAFSTCALRDDGTLWCFGTSVEGQLGLGARTGVFAEPQRVGTATDWRSISAGPYHLCAIHGAPAQRGEIACWGYDPSDGRIGDGGNTSRFAPTPVLDDGVVDWSRVAVGEYAACALDAVGQLSCWGERFHLPGGDPAAVPTRYAGITGADRVAAGGFGGCLVTDGVVSCWGGNSEGALGSPPTQSGEDPVVVAGLGTVLEVDVGAAYACALDAAGVIACWGDNGDGQLGDGVIADHRTPVEVLGGHAPWRQVDVGVEHTCAVTMSGVAYCWGSNLSGQLGGGVTMIEPVYPAPIAIDSAASFQHIVAGDRHSCAITTTTGLLHCWGANDRSQRGVAAASAYVPTAVDAVALSTLSTGTDSTCGVAASGGARRCWGANAGTELGNAAASSPPVNVPTPIGAGPAAWSRVTMGVIFGCGISGGGAAGILYCWGQNAAGQAATDPTLDDPVVIPVQVEDPTIAVADSWIDAAAGYHHACGILSELGNSGGLWCWGENGQGQLGNELGSGYQQRLVAGSADWIDVDVGNAHTCALRATGVLHCFGANDSGQLGDGTPYGRSALGAPIAGATDWVALSAGNVSSCGIRDAVERRLYCWGENRHGQLGTGERARWEPAAVARP